MQAAAAPLSPAMNSRRLMAIPPECEPRLAHSQRSHRRQPWSFQNRLNRPRAKAVYRCVDAFASRHRDDECQAMGWQLPVTNRYAAIFAFASQAHWPRSEHRTCCRATHRPPTDREKGASRCRCDLHKAIRSVLRLAVHPDRSRPYVAVWIPLRTQHVIKLNACCARTTTGHARRAA